jgi:hypothetical protein
LCANTDGIYLLGPGTEVIGSLWFRCGNTSAVDLVRCLSSTLSIGVGLCRRGPAQCVCMAELIVKDVAPRLATTRVPKVLARRAAGEVVALLGPSGSGKTTLLRAVGLETPHQGRLPSAIAYSSMRPVVSTFRQRSADSGWCFSPTRFGRIALFSTTSHMD